MQTIVITDNNPNLIPGIILIICVSFIVAQIVSINLKIKRKKRLENVKKKIEKRHDIMENEYWREEQYKNAKSINNTNNGL